jgi:hypothetical protein
MQIRKLFAERSGRFDLLNEDDSDSGADFFIQAGTRFLDKSVQHLKSKATSFIAVAANDFYKTFTRCRAIERVWISNTESRTEVELCTPIDFYQAFAGPVSTRAPGRPAYYTPINLRSTDLTAFESLAQFLQYVTTDDEAQTGVVFNVADGDYVLEIEGLFESDELLANYDDNFWSVNYPDLLLMASLYKLEVFNRNTAGANDWLAGITAELIELEKDMITQHCKHKDLR